MPLPRPATGLLLVAALTACSGTSTPLAAPSRPPTGTPTTVAVPVPTARPTTPAPRPGRSSARATPSPAATWVVGASPLPVGADGFGKVLPTPKVLRNRRLQQPDDLPPPHDGRFHATVSAVSGAIRTRMGDTYKPGCPVALADLRYLTLVFRGFDGAAHTGELVVAATAAGQTVRAFSRLFALGFPIEQMVLPTTEDVHAKPTGDGNDTAAFVCRAARQQTRFSAHAFGEAIDVNPFQNPYVKGDLVLPELAGSYTDRSFRRAGMFEPGSAAVKAFTGQGFTWGGNFHRPKDYQHMSLTGN